MRRIVFPALLTSLLVTGCNESKTTPSVPSKTTGPGAMYAHPKYGITPPAATTTPTEPPGAPGK
jgi:hypothetical protein